MYMHKSGVNATYSVGLDAFLVKFTFLSPVTPSWPRLVKIRCREVFENDVLPEKEENRRK